MTQSVVQSDQKIYDLIREAVSRVHVARGVLETARLLERRKAKLVVLAADVQPPARLNIVRELCRRFQVQTLVVSNKNQLGASAGLEVAASCVALPVSIE